MATTAEQVDRDGIARVEHELGQLVESNLPAEQFFPQFLDVVAQAIGTEQGSVWGLNQRGLVSKICDLQVADVGETESLAAARRHVNILLKVLHSGKSDIYRPGSDTDGEQFVRQVLLLAPVRLHENCVGVIELCLAAETSPERAREHLLILDELSDYASRYLANRGRTESTSDQAVFLGRLEQVVLQLHRAATTHQTALTAANEGRWLLGCDRVSIAVRRGKHAHVLAVSGQDRVVQRSNLVRALTKVATQTLVSGQAIRYAGSLSGQPPQVEKPLVDYLAESGARRFEAIPLFEPTPPDDESAQSARPQALAVLIVEQLSERGPATSPQGVEKLAAHVSLALFNSLAQERIFLLPLWRAVGKFLHSARRDKFTKAAGIAVALAVSVAVLALVPVPYRVEAEGKLVPVEQRRIFAPQDAEVVEVLVRGGEHVAPGQPLLRLRNEEVSLRALLARNQLSEKQQLLSALEASGDEVGRPVSREDHIRLRGRISQTRLEIEGLRQQLAALEQEQAELEVRSAIAGTIATFEPQELLIGRPVQRGQLLVEVMDESGPWQLELQVPAHRLGHILGAQDIGRSLELPVQFVLATTPERTFAGKLQALSTRTTVAPDRSTFVPAHVSLDKSAIPGRTVEAEVVARINCGNRCLAYVLFGDLLEFVQKRIW